NFQVKIAISFLMEHTYQYAWVIPLLPLPVIMSMGFGLFLVPTATKNLRRIWAFPSVLLLSIAMVFSVHLSIQQINGSSIYQYLWSWTVNNDFSLEFGYLIDPLTSIMLILITTVGILVLIYSDDYMSHDERYLRFFVYISFFNTSMLGLVTSSNLIQIYFFWELVGMCSYLLIGFWFTRPIAASACQKAFVTNRVGDFGLLLGILGFFWITGSLEFRDLFKIANNWIPNNEINSLLTILCAFLLFLGAVGKSAQFPLHVWLPDAMEGPTPISALIHAATMVAAGIFLIARLLPLFISLPLIMSFISLIGTLTLFENTFQLQELVFYGVPFLFVVFYLLLGFWSKDEILSNSWLYSPFFGIIASFTAGLTAFYMFRIYLLTFDGYLRVHFQNYSSTKEDSLYSISLWGKRISKGVNRDFVLSTAKSGVSFFSQNLSKIHGNTGNRIGSFSTSLGTKNTFVYPHEPGNTMLFPLLILLLCTLFIGSIGIHFDNEIGELTILSKWLTPSIN
uniref:NAD(P)H-quinone oxidoreductase subunit 5, chloroplastic n=1 Tax=Oryza glaberrima TaxID=4538 RepID=I1PBK9_ORYGL